MSEFAGLPKGEPDFILACRRLGESSDAVISGRGGLTFSRDVLRELGANRSATSTRHRNIVASLAAYAARVKAGGAEFVVVPVPPKPVIYPDHLPHEPALKDRRYDSYLQALYGELLRNGVRVIDVADELHDDRFDNRGNAFPKGDSHWSPRAAQTAAAQVYKELKRVGSLKSLPRDKTIIERQVKLAAAGESMRARMVGMKSGDVIERIPPAPGRAVVVLVRRCQCHGLSPG